MSRYVLLTHFCTRSSSDYVDIRLPRFLPRMPKIWDGTVTSVGCDVRTFTSLILLLFMSKDSHSILWGDVELRFLLTAFVLPRLRVWPPCDVALLLRFLQFHWALILLSHLVRFCDVPLLLRFWPELGNESATFFFHVVLGSSSSSSSSGDELLHALRVWLWVLALARNVCTEPVTFFLFVGFEPVAFFSRI